jgi:hypothetical protein
VTALRIDARFNGPPASGNGGYVAGCCRAAGRDRGEVTLRAPPPLEAALRVEARDDGSLALLDGERLLAEARAMALVLDVPAWPGLERAAAAGRAGAGCASARPPRQSVRALLRLRHRACRRRCGSCRRRWTRRRPGRHRLDARGVAGRADGTLPAPLAWAALDCPAGIAWTHRLTRRSADDDRPIAASIDAPLRAGRRHVVMGWPIAQDGRKLHAGTAILADDGRVVARSLQLWLLPRAA